MSFVIIQCGSSARGDANINSDIDLVCIWSETPPNYDAISSEYDDVVFYSQETIRRMKEKGSLFLTHLDVDGVFLAGNKNLLNEFKDFRPLKSQITKQHNETRRLIARLQWYPDSIIGQLWLCDVIYVALRTCVYCKNALSGHYAFGYLDALAKFGLSEENIRTMLIIRQGKYLYRKNRTTASCTSELSCFDGKLVELACRAITECTVRFVAGGSTKWEKIKRNDYWSERLIERAILNGEYHDDEFMKKMTRHNYHKVSLKTDASKILESQKKY
ncbi:nucleotidyltransferase domain-containing protein [Pseudomonas sp. Leaf59]|uniref:nucleotidyltransferase domain-containing protein n=1 Tax=Pseudomonas sp. Leaf59 TaxID=2876556 RepID=UPI001E53CCDB|nr:nucleotidyltransferase domain-containing protein [Pseudomonas sp. Leaf59]